MANGKQYKIRARLVFGGHVTVAARSRKEAEAIAEMGIAALLGKVEVQPEAEDLVTDWDFPVHGAIVVNRKQQEEGGE